MSVMLARSAADFAPEFKARMLHAYPVLAKLSRREQYGATRDELDAAFSALLASHNIGPICRQEWTDNPKVRAS